MTVPSTVGSAVEINDTGSISQSITVPSGTDCCLMYVGGWVNDAGGNAPTTTTLGGSAFTLIDSEGTTTGMFVYAYRINSPSSGSQTLVVTVPDTWSQGAITYLVFYQDVDTSGDPVRDSDKDNDTGFNVTVTTPSFSTDTNDLVIVGACCYHLDIDAAPGGSGQTEIFNNAYNYAGVAVATKAGSAGTTTVKVYGDQPSVIGLSLKGSTDGLSIPVAMHQYRQQGMSY